MLVSKNYICESGSYLPGHYRSGSNSSGNFGSGSEFFLDPDPGVDPFRIRPKILDFFRNIYHFFYKLSLKSEKCKLLNQRKARNQSTRLIINSKSEFILHGSDLAQSRVNLNTGLISKKNCTFLYLIIFLGFGDGTTIFGTMIDVKKT